MTRFLAFQIGCLECGEVSAVLGLHADQEKAQEQCNAASEAHQKDWHGQRAFCAFDLEAEGFPCVYEA